MPETRGIDIIWAPLGIGIAGALVVLAFQNKLEALRDRNPTFLLLIAGVFLLLGLGFVQAKASDFPIAIPLPNVSADTESWQRLLRTSVVASFMIFAAIGFPAEPRNDEIKHPRVRELFSRHFERLFLLQFMVAVMSKQPSEAPIPWWTAYLPVGLFALTLVFAASNAMVMGFRVREEVDRDAMTEPVIAAGHPMNKRRTLKWLSHGVRVLSLAGMWAGAIVGMW